MYRDIPVDMKYIADPTMHSMPAVTPAPNGKWLACQSMDNKIVIFSALNRFKMNRKKTFTGHMVAGYACTLDFSPDMRYITNSNHCNTYVWQNRYLYIYYYIVIWCRAMLMVNVTSGTGRLRNCTRSGRHTTMSVSTCSGTHTNQVNWSQPAGMESSSIGTSYYHITFILQYFTFILQFYKHLHTPWKCKYKCE